MATPDVWDEYRRRRNLFWFAFFGYLPLVALVGVLSFRVFSTFAPAMIAAIAGVLVLVIAAQRALRFRCPRCGELFFKKWMDQNGFARRCLHCGLPKYADPTPGSRQ